MAKNVKEQLVLAKRDCRDYKTNKTEYKNCIFDKVNRLYMLVFRTIDRNKRWSESPFGKDKLRDVINGLDL